MSISEDHAILKPDPEELTAFQDADQKVDAFERLLQTHGIKIEAKTQIEHGCLVVKQLHERHGLAKSNQKIPAWPTLRDDLQVAIGTLNMIDSILERQFHSDFAQLLPHLRLLSAGSVAQTTPAAATDQASNKLFELRLALACLRSCTELQMDDPDASSGGDNPDILCKLSDGRRWGFACKVVHGDSPMTLFDRVKEGVEQIERSKADVGMVAISFKNRLPHATFFPEIGKDGQDNFILGAQGDKAALLNELVEAVRGRVTQMQEHVSTQEALALFRGKKALPGVLVPVEVVVGFQTKQGPLPSHFAYMQVVAIDVTQFNASVKPVLNELNLGMVPRRVAARL